MVLTFIPCRAEQHRKVGGFQRGLFEGFSPSSAAAQLFEAAQEINGSGVAFSLVSFFWLSKRKKLA